MAKNRNKQNNQNGDQNKCDGGHKVEEEIETKNGAKKEDKKDVVIKVHMHCEGCANKVFNCLKGFDGVEDVVIDNANHKVIVKGRNVDPTKVLGRLQKKYSRNAELLSPKPKPDKKDKMETPKNEEPKMKTLVLKISMHCEGCEQDIKRNVGRMEGVMTVEPDMKKSLVVIRGVFDPQKLVDKISKQLGKRAEIVEQESEKQKGKDQRKCTENEHMSPYPPQYHVKYIYPSLIFGDDNVFSCSIM